MTAKQKIICPPKHSRNTPTVNTFDKDHLTKSCKSREWAPVWVLPHSSPPANTREGGGLGCEEQKCPFLCSFRQIPPWWSLWKDVLAKTIMKLGEVQRRKASRTREPLCEQRECVLERKEMAEENTLQNHRSTEMWNYLGWKGPLRSPGQAINPALPSPPLNHSWEAWTREI